MSDTRSKPSLCAWISGLGIAFVGSVSSRDIQQVSWLAALCIHAFSRAGVMHTLGSTMAFCGFHTAYSDRIAQDSHLIPFYLALPDEH